MSDEKEYQKNIVSKKDLGNGKRQVTFKVDATDLNKYYDTFQKNGIDVQLEDGFQIGRGSVRSRYEITGNEYLREYTSNFKPYTRAFKIPVEPHKKIELAMELYFKEPIIGTVIDMMVDFSASGFENDCDDKNIKKYYDEWVKKINLQETVEQIFLEYYRTGNVTIYRSHQDMNVNVKGASGRKKSYAFPAGYTVLNPMRVHVRGPLLFGNEMLTLSIAPELKEMDDLMRNQQLIDMMPDEFRKAFLSGTEEVVLSKDQTTRITRKRQPYERYAIPSLQRVFEPVFYKQKLREMDMSTIEGLMNQLVTVTVGNDNYPATDDDLEAVAELFQTPNKAFTVFWNHTLEVKFHKPEGLDSLNEDKYAQVNEDILAGLGVTRVLLDGQGSNFSTAWVSILSLIQRLDNARNKIARWLEDEYEKIAEKNNFSTHPTVRFDSMNLREDTYIRDVLLAMYDRGLIDEEDVLRETGRNYEAVVDMKKRNKDNEKWFIPPVQPFQGKNNGSPFTSDGRPPGPNENGYKDRQTSPEQSGNAPKPRKTSTASMAIAYNSNVEEDYKLELQNSYDYIKSELLKMKDNKKDFKVILASAMLTTFVQMLSSVSDKYINDVYENNLKLYASDNLDQNLISKNISDLKNWNDSYIHKIANDLKNTISTSIHKGLPVDEAIKKAFDSNQYRVNLIAQAGVIETSRQAKIFGNKFAGKTTGVWTAHIDDATCNICSELDGQQFSIDAIPPRPHSGCRCDIDFI